MAERIKQLLYMSEVNGEPGDGLLEGIRAQSNRNNRERDISGCLLFSRGHFLQLLEGPEAAVTDLFVTISSDGRHVRVRLLHEGVVEQRLFEDWEMRSYNLDEASDLPPEFSERVLDWLESSDAHPSSLLHILDDFRKFL